MDLGIIAGIVLLVIWLVGTLMFGAPAWLNLLLTAGVTMLVWRVVVRGTRAPSDEKAP